MKFCWNLLNFVVLCEEISLDKNVIFLKYFSKFYDIYVFSCILMEKSLFFEYGRKLVCEFFECFLYSGVVV